MKNVTPKKEESRETEHREKEMTEEEKNKKEVLPEQPKVAIIPDKKMNFDFQSKDSSEGSQLVYSESQPAPNPIRRKAYTRKRISRKRE